VTLAGHVTVGRGAQIFTGGVVAPNVAIGEDTTVGAGSIVLENLPANSKAFGNPARLVKQQ